MAELSMFLMIADLEPWKRDATYEWRGKRVTLTNFQLSRHIQGRGEAYEESKSDLSSEEG